MASMLAPNLKQQYKVKSLPVVKGDEVKVMRGSDKTKGKEGKVTAVYRRKYVIHVERCTREKSNKQVCINAHAHTLSLTPHSLTHSLSHAHKIQTGCPHWY